MLTLLAPSSSPGGQQPGGPRTVRGPGGRLSIGIPEVGLLQLEDGVRQRSLDFHSENDENWCERESLEWSCRMMTRRGEILFCRALFRKANGGDEHSHVWTLKFGIPDASDLSYAPSLKRAGAEAQAKNT